MFLGKKKPLVTKPDVNENLKWKKWLIMPPGENFYYFCLRGWSSANMSALSFVCYWARAHGSPLYDKRRKSPTVRLYLKLSKMMWYWNRGCWCHRFLRPGQSEPISQLSHPHSHFAHRKHNLDCIISAPLPPVIETGGRDVDGDVC